MSKLDLIKPYITKDQPFGPIDSIKIDSADIEVLSLLFEKQNRIYKSFRDRPSIIMGRRGSGKTSYLRSVYFEDQYNYYVEIMTASVLEHISGVVEDMSKDNVFTETISMLWEKTLWTCVLAQIRRNSSTISGDLSVVDVYLGMMEISVSDSIDTVLWKLANFYREVLDTSPKSGVTEVLRCFEDRNFEGAKAAAIKGLKLTNKKCVILMDSLEDFKLNIESVGRALEGLLKFVGAMNNPKDVVDIRICLPTELTRKVFEISSNALKDFDHELRLEWTPSELILIGAQRLMYFLGLYYPNLIGRKSPLEELKRSEALDLFRTVLPEKITNLSGFQENSISYILRHTQLLPRHFIMLLNSIFRGTIYTQNFRPFPIGEERIINGVRQVEERIVKEIFGAFRMMHPAAEEACKRCLPHLGHIFSVGKLQEVYNRHGKAVYNWGAFFEFRQMLTEIGAVGRVIRNGETDLYIKGKFRYTIGHELNISYDDALCLHPLFSGIYRGDSERGHPVYPEGNDINDSDYRDNAD